MKQKYNTNRICSKESSEEFLKAYVEGTLRKLVVPEGVEVLYDFFRQCSISSIYLPKSLKKIPDYIVIDNCPTSNISVYYDGTISDWEKIEKKNSWWMLIDSSVKTMKVICTDGTITLRD